MIDELKDLFECYNRGYNHRASKETLCTYFKCSERQLRRTITELRQSGMAICSNSKSSGYWLTSKELLKVSPEEREQVETMIIETKSRMKQLAIMLQPVMKEFYSGDGVQGELFLEKT